MNMKRIKDYAKMAMVAGAGLFTLGAGTNFICNYLENKDAKRLHKNNMMEIEERELEKKYALEEESIRTATAKNALYSEKLKTMDNEVFAKFHAENVAKANNDVLAKAERIRKDADSEVIKIRMECRDEIDKIKAECLKKIEEANKQRDKAVEEYESIDELFTNRKEILKAKKDLENALAKDKKAKDDKEELIQSIKDILD